MTQRQEIIERLNGLELKGGSHEMLSALGKAILPHGDAWTLRMCEDLRDRLVRLLGEADAAPCGGRITDELPDLLRKAAKGGYEGSRGDVIDNIAQLIGCKSNMAHIVIAELADKVEQALREAYTKGHLSGFDEAERWHTEHGDWLGENTHTPPSDGGRITDELRHDIEGAEQLYGQEYPRLRAIADRIDAAYEKTIASVMNDALYHANDEDMAALGWVRLPKDADGEYIHVGDMMYDGLSRDFTPMKVKMLMLEGDEWMLNFGSGWSSTKNHEWHHYHAPTVKDVLTDCCRRYYEAFRRSLEDRDHDKPTASEVIEQFAKRLRLVDDRKEQ